jgi:membrane protein
VRGPVRGALDVFYALDGFFLAAGLSFYVVVCIVPFLLLVVVGGGFLLSNDTVLRGVQERLALILPVYQSQIEAMLGAIIQNRGVSSVVGTVILVFFASQLFAGTRLVLNRILHAKGHGFVHGTLYDLGMIVLLTVLFFVAIGVTAAFGWVQGVVMLAEPKSWVATGFRWAGVGLALGLNTVLFLALYRLVPNTRVLWSSAAVGSMWAAALWEVAKEIFRWYIEGIGLYSAVYGSLGVTIALMMWVYYSALVFVLGACLVRALEDVRLVRGRV